MKKIDFHIHTVPTEKDSDFEFDIDILQKYVSDMSIDAIAITNHNMFDKQQFLEITNALKGTTVFPGIEIDFVTGHILIISEISDLEDFDEKCKAITQKISITKKSIAQEDFNSIFIEKSKYIIIPHYDKAPKISNYVLEQIKNIIDAGEVASPKKFETCKKENGLTPVLFSDWRATKNFQDSANNFPNRHTFVKVADLTVPKIKLALKSKKNVFLTSNEQDEVFEMLKDGTLASTGLNIVLGKRSSGKSYTLDSIFNNFATDRIKYIKQFDLIKKSDNETFSNIIEREKDEFTTTYFIELKRIVEYIGSFDWNSEINKIDTYINTLKNYAINKEKDDIFSRAKLFSESIITKEDNTELKKLIHSVIAIIENKKYAEMINEHINQEYIIKLLLKLIDTYNSKMIDDKMINEANTIIKDVKDSLGKKSALNPIDDVGLSVYFKMIIIEDEFDKLISLNSKKRIISSSEQYGFRIYAEIALITSAADLNRSCNIKNTSSLLKEKLSPFQLYRQLKENKEEYNLKIDDVYKAFWKLSYSVKNMFDTDLSGGEKAEYNLLAELKEAYKYDLVLIDEPESSFDNTFIKDNVISEIKELSNKATVFVVTHNNTLGVLLSPDYLIVTEKEMTTQGAMYTVYTGELTSKTLKSVCGKVKNNYLSLLETMEAGEDAYIERRNIYEAIKN